MKPSPEAIVESLPGNTAHAAHVPAVPSRRAGAAVPAEIRPEYGVSPDRMKLYRQLSETFLCDDGKVALPVSAVNDNYCDCKDGTDEPGTSACPNGHFYCSQDRRLLFSNVVNDGVCDCCDGSDEYLRLVQCPDSCQTYREQRQQEHHKRQQGAHKRQEYVEQAYRVL